MRFLLASLLFLSVPAMAATIIHYHQVPVVDASHAPFYDPILTPDDNKALTVSSGSGNIAYEINVIDLKTETLDRQIPLQAWGISIYNYDVEISPDSRFVSLRGGTTNSTKNLLLLIELATGKVWEIANNSDSDSDSTLDAAYFTPNSRFMAYATLRRNQADSVNIVDLQTMGNITAATDQRIMLMGFAKVPGADLYEAVFAGNSSIKTFESFEYIKRVSPQNGAITTVYQVQDPITLLGPNLVEGAPYVFVIENNPNPYRTERILSLNLFDGSNILDLCSSMSSCFAYGSTNLGDGWLYIYGSSSTGSGTGSGTETLLDAKSGKVLALPGGPYNGIFSGPFWSWDVAGGRFHPTEPLNCIERSHPIA